MRKQLLRAVLVLSGFLSGYSALNAWAEDVAPASPTSRADAEEVSHGYLNDEVVSFKPAVGAVGYTDAFSQSTSRLLLGAVVDFNTTSLISEDRRFYLGPSTGFFFAHLGSPTSNFVGTSPDFDMGNAGSNFIQIPLNLKGGYSFSDGLRLSLRMGGNVTYRSDGSSMQLGSSSAESGGVWKLFPNIGGDAEIALGRNIELLLRPDFTFTPGEDIFTGVLALGLMLS